MATHHRESDMRARMIELEMEALMAMTQIEDEDESENNDLSINLNDTALCPPKAVVAVDDEGSRQFQTSFENFVKEQSKKRATKSLSPRLCIRNTMSSSAHARSTPGTPSSALSRRKPRVHRSSLTDESTASTSLSTTTTIPSPRSTKGVVSSPRSRRNHAKGTRSQACTSSRTSTSATALPGLALPVELPLAGEEEEEEDQTTTLTETTVDAETPSTLSAELTQATTGSSSNRSSSSRSSSTEVSQPCRRTSEDRKLGRRERKSTPHESSSARRNRQ
jgi:hypothetical protein